MPHRIIEINDETIWHKERSLGIGGSDAAAIIGKNPYKTNVDLWKEKTGRKKPKDISEKPCIVYGKKAESYLREIFALDYPQYQIVHNPYDIHINNEFDFIRASLDGELLDLKISQIGILEIKTTEIKSPSMWNKWKDRIPDNYFTQVLHYFLIDEEFKFCKLKAQIKHKDANGEIQHTTKHYHILREDHKEDINYLLKKETEFWHYVKTDKQPPLILPEI